MYSVRLEWPQDSTNRSRPSHWSSLGSCRITWWNSRYATGARLIAVPGWPLPTFWTASAASNRAVSTARESRSVQPSGYRPSGAGLSVEVESVTVSKSFRSQRARHRPCMAIRRAYRSGTLPPPAVGAIDSLVVTSIDMSDPPFADRVGTVSSGDVTAGVPSYLSPTGSPDSATAARARV